MIPLLNPGLTLADIPRHYPELRFGLRQPKVVELAPQRLHRIASTFEPGSTRLLTPWWFTDAALEEIQRAIRPADRPPAEFEACPEAARYDWGTMDLIVSVRLARPTLAFQGNGSWKVSYSIDGLLQEFAAPAGLVPLYLPGLKPADGRPTNPEMLESLEFLATSHLFNSDSLHSSLAELTAALAGDRSMARGRQPPVLPPSRGNPRLN